jgi:hypothetical protein
MSHKTEDRLYREILKLGLVDWVPLFAVERAALLRFGAADEGDACDVARATIHRLAMEGLCLIGEISDGGFLEWDVPIDSAIDRIADLCKAGGPDDRGFVVWLANTPAGNAAAERIASEEGQANGGDRQ